MFESKIVLTLRNLHIPLKSNHEIANSSYLGISSTLSFFQPRL